MLGTQRHRDGANDERADDDFATSIVRPRRLPAPTGGEQPGNLRREWWDLRGAVLDGPRREEAPVDVVQWLSGDDADEAYLRESGDDSGAPNDYYIVDERDELRTAPVADEAVILMLRADGHAGSLHTVPFDSIPIDDPHRTFWLTFTEDAITEVCQQYRP